MGAAALIPSGQQLDLFLAAFPGRRPNFFVRAPGRVNLIGEHVDYNAGLVLPIATQQGITLLGRRADDRHIRGRSATTGEGIDFDLDAFSPPMRAGWPSFVMGTAAALAQRGVPLVGCEFVLDSDLPTAAGLSSSAALEVALAMAFLAASRTAMPRAEIARLCRHVEHRFVGVPCGIMDMFASALSRAGHALYLDCRDEQIQHVPWPAADHVVVIVDSGLPRALSAGEYEHRVAQCAAALMALARGAGGPRTLRDVTLAELEDRRMAMGDIEFRRARHVVTEIDRTRQAVAALRQGDFAAFGRLMDESHASLRDDYEVSLPQLDRLVELLRGVNGVVGARLTGAGFGGCVIAIAPAGAVADIRACLAAGYDKPLGLASRVFQTAPADGAQSTELPVAA